MHEKIDFRRSNVYTIELCVRKAETKKLNKFAFASQAGPNEIHQTICFRISSLRKYFVVNYSEIDSQTEFVQIAIQIQINQILRLLTIVSSSIVSLASQPLPEKPPTVQNKKSYEGHAAVCECAFGPLLSVSFENSMHINKLR